MSKSYFFGPSKMCTCQHQGIMWFCYCTPCLPSLMALLFFLLFIKLLLKLYRTGTLPNIFKSDLWVLLSWLWYNPGVVTYGPWTRSSPQRGAIQHQLLVGVWSGGAPAWWIFWKHAEHLPYENQASLNYLSWGSSDLKHPNYKSGLKILFDSFLFCSLMGLVCSESCVSLLPYPCWKAVFRLPT